jgi:hypothetical protein
LGDAHGPQCSGAPATNPDFWQQLRFPGIPGWGRLAFSGPADTVGGPHEAVRDGADLDASSRSYASPTSGGFTTYPTVREDGTAGRPRARGDVTSSGKVGAWGKVPTDRLTL